MAGPIQVTASSSLKRKRLSKLLAEQGRTRDDPSLRRAVWDAQLTGSLALAGLGGARTELAQGEGAAGDLRPAARLSRARAAVDPQAPFSAAALLAWHTAATGDEGYRTSERSRELAADPAPPAFIADRLANLEEWIRSSSCEELPPVRVGALALARIVEILPFEDGNGRVSRLAASHILVARDLEPPILEASDEPGLVEALRAAFRLETEPLVELLELASDRSLDVMIGLLVESG